MRSVARLQFLNVFVTQLFSVDAGVDVGGHEHLRPLEKLYSLRRRTLLQPSINRRSDFFCFPHSLINSGRFCGELLADSGRVTPPIWTLAPPGGENAAVRLGDTSCTNSPGVPQGLVFVCVVTGAVNDPGGAAGSI